MSGWQNWDDRLQRRAKGGRSQVNIAPLWNKGDERCDSRRYGTPLDVLIIGGGIVGAGIARDAAMRGLKVGLVEQHDFAFGTSSRSSRLLHGGMRYLAQGRIGLGA